MADTFVKNPKLIVGTQAQIESEMGANDIGFATDVEFYTAEQIDELLENSGGASLPILMPMWSDHLLNDVSWLRADSFSWHSGDVYVAAHDHLRSEFQTPQTSTYYAWTGEGPIAGMQDTVFTTSQVPSVGDTVYDYASGGRFLRFGTVTAASSTNITFTYIDGGATSSPMEYYGEALLPVHLDIIDGITIAYSLAQDGHKICLPDQESNLVALYEATGAADYYILDTTNKQFKLPRKQKRTLIQAVKNDDGTWYNLYSDGYVEQGGYGISGSSGAVTLPVEMADASYHIVFGGDGRSSNNNTVVVVGYNKTTTGFTIQSNVLNNAGSSSATGSSGSSWQVNGYAAESAYASAGMRLEYYYVGNFEQSAIEQTAGITAETLNGKADASLGNIPTNYDYVVEKQDPTADNNYTWYRKYKSGWVEQGVLELSFTTTVQTWTFPIPMADTHYVSIPVKQSNNNNNIIVYRDGTTACKYNVSAGSQQTGGIYISGMSEQ